MTLSPYKRRRLAEQEIQSIDEDAPVLQAAVSCSHLRTLLGNPHATPDAAAVRSVYLVVRDAAHKQFGDQAIGFGFNEASRVPVPDLIATAVLLLVGTDAHTGPKVKTSFPNPRSWEGKQQDVAPVVLRDLELCGAAKFSRTMTYLSCVLSKHPTVKVQLATDYMARMLAAVCMIPSAADLAKVEQRRRQAVEQLQDALADGVDAVAQRQEQQERHPSAAAVQDHDAQFAGVDQGVRTLLAALVQNGALSHAQGVAVLASMQKVVNDTKASRFLLSRFSSSTTASGASTPVTE